MKRGAHDMWAGDFVGERVRCTAPNPLGGNGVRFRYPCETRLPVPNRTKVRRDPEGAIECPHSDCSARYSVMEEER